MLKRWLQPEPVRALQPGDAWLGEPLSTEAVQGHGRAEPRQIAWGERGMGGPEFWTLLLPDGTVLPDLCSPLVALDAGRWQLAQTLDGLLVHDRSAHSVTRLDAAGSGRAPGD